MLGTSLVGIVFGETLSHTDLDKDTHRVINSVFTCDGMTINYLVVLYYSDGSADWRVDFQKDGETLYRYQNSTTSTEGFMLQHTMFETGYKHYRTC
jgi:hypothetical protein